MCPGFLRQHENLSRKELRLAAESIYKASGVKKRRMGSCDACRTSKISCNKIRPACSRCVTRNIQCKYNSETGSLDTMPEPRLSQAAPSPPITLARHDEVMLLDDPALRLRLLGIYFDRVHPLRCLAFIHKPSFMYSLDRESLLEEYDASLVDAMCALGAR